MKKVTLFFLLIFVIARSNAQDYQITFEATGLSSTIDSVKIENLTQGISHTQNGTDSLHLTVINGISLIEVNGETIKVYPNPMLGQTELSFFAKKTGNVQLKIIDISGKEVLQINGLLSQGNQWFKIIGLKQGIYFIRISGENYFYTAKLISMNSNNSEAKIKYYNSEKSKVDVVKFKNEKSNENMTYTIGDSIRFTGYSGIYIASVTDVITANRTITFLFAILPTITTTNITSITQTTATCGGNVTSDGGSAVTFRGVCWSISQNPVASGSHTTNSTGTGIFTSNITGLTANTPYYVRAYATNSIGTAYGNETNFSTSPGLPVVSTNAITDIAQISATSGGNVTSDGGATVTARGVCWSTSQNPVATGSHTTNSTGTGTFTSNITGLTANTPYYVRAYATNSIGTAYGNETNFSTQNISLPIVSTNSVTDITQITAVSGGNITSNGGGTITARGVCWSTSQNPLATGSHTNNSTGTGTFTSIITGLTANTPYYVRAYATNSIGTAYGNETNFSTTNSLSNCGTVMDAGSNTYNTVYIGTQCWMRENLKTNQYNNSVIITNVIDITQWSTSTSGAWCYYNNDVANNATYGKLYNWYAVNTGNLCPTGWRVPTETDWITLTDYLTNYGYGYSGSGNSIAKSMAATSGWTSDPAPGNVGNDQINNNSSGFTALPAGNRAITGGFYNIGTWGGWWSSTEDIIYSTIYYRDMSSASAGVGIGNSNKLAGYSVRCVKN